MTDLGLIAPFGAAMGLAMRGERAEGTTPTPAARTEPMVGRNDPCPCGSGKKYKRCHG